MWMIGKLGKDQEGILALSICQSWCMHTTPQDQPSWDIAHSIWCSGWWLCLPTDFYFPTIVNTERPQHVQPLCCWLMWMTACKAFKEAQAQSTSEAERQGWYYEHKANAISLEPGDLVMAKANAYKGRRKVKDLVGGGTIQSGMQDCWRHHFLPHVQNQWTRHAHESSTGIDFFSLAPQWELLYVQVYELSRQGAPPTFWRNLLSKWVRLRKCHKVSKCLPLAQHARQVRLL